MRKRRDPDVMSSLKLYGNFAGRLRDEVQPEVRFLSDNELHDKAAIAPRGCNTAAIRLRVVLARGRVREVARVSGKRTGTEP
jgi:hypothetical protein